MHVFIDLSIQRNRNLARCKRKNGRNAAQVFLSSEIGADFTVTKIKSSNMDQVVKGLGLRKKCRSELATTDPQTDLADVRVHPASGMRNRRHAWCITHTRRINTDLTLMHSLVLLLSVLPQAGPHGTNNMNRSTSTVVSYGTLKREISRPLSRSTNGGKASGGQKLEGVKHRLTFLADGHHLSRRIRDFDFRDGDSINSAEFCREFIFFKDEKVDS
ncbi:hypothetical protein RRG08_021416 [Elysia crispata]|uniref:Uncharacterized protein n=1 Tax=Elysia crispata TaxID=231223 RepID=A0AAE1DTI2_9GAST|nr:hypothetical protein RRG08_021416 [Elysia crispata]